MAAYVLDPGELTERVTLQSRSTAQDAYGQATITWTDVATVWARVRPVSGREFFAAAQVQQEQTVKVLVRYRTDVLPTWREWVEILCLQGVKDGR